MGVTKLRSTKKIKKNKTIKKNLFPSPPSEQSSTPYPLPQLPTLDWEWGYKYVTDETSGETKQAPLTLLDILYPTGEEFYMAENRDHHELAQLLELIIKAHLTPFNWLIIANAFIHWGWPSVPPLAPDIAAIPQGTAPPKGESYRVGEHGPLPAFVLEITSKSTRKQDISRKEWDYAAVGVKEYLIIDMWPEDKGDFQLHGYRLEDKPFYRPLESDKDGRLTFETIGLQFKAIGQETVAVYNTETGERLLSPQEKAEELAARVAELEKALQQAENKL